MTRNSLILVLVLCLGCMGVAQIGGRGGSLMLLGVASKVANIPAGEAAYEIPIVLDPSSDGDDFIHIRRESAPVALSLRMPGGTVITPANAAAAGFTWNEVTITAGVNDPEENDDGLGPDFASEGTHSAIVFPPSQPAGTYVLVADSTAVSAASGVVVDLYMSSPVRASAATDAASYKAGDSVTVVAIVFDDETPVSSATVTATVGASRDVTAQTNVGSFVLSRKVDLGNGNARYEYRATLTSGTGNAAWRYLAKCDSDDESVRMVSAALTFPEAPSGNIQSTNEIIVIAPAAPEFDPATLEWEIQAVSPPVTLNLIDVGPGSDLAGDGVFASRFQPTEAGEHHVSIEIQGTTAIGRPFYRNGATAFTVIAPQATVASITSSGIDENNSQKYEEIRFTASIDVQEPGEYTISFQIKEIADHASTFLRAAELTAGANQILLDADAKALIDAGFTSGPLSIVGVTLRREVFGRDAVVDYHETMGVTPSYDLGDFDRGSIHFTSQVSEQAALKGTKQ